MALPVLGVDNGVRNRVSAVDHPIVAHIDAYMGDSGGVVGALKKIKSPGRALLRETGVQALNKPWADVLPRFQPE